MSIIVSESYYRQIIKIIKNIYNASYFNPYYFCLKERKKTLYMHKEKNESLQFISTIQLLDVLIADDNLKYRN